MATEDRAHVRWEWVAALAVSILVLMIGSMWQEKAKQAAEDHAELGKVTIQVDKIDERVGRIETATQTTAKAVQGLSEASNARWGALLDALPDVEKKLRKTTPVFAPEWHYRTDTPQR